MDGWIALDASTPKMTKRLFEGYGLGNLLDDPRFADNESRVRNAPQFDALLTANIGKRTLTENLQIIKDNGLTAMQVQSIADVEHDPQWSIRQYFRDVSDPALGKVRMHGVVPVLSATPGDIRWTGGELGRDNAQIYGDELGLSEQRLDELRTAGVI